MITNIANAFFFLGGGVLIFIIMYPIPFRVWLLYYTKIYTTTLILPAVFSLAVRVLGAIGRIDLRIRMFREIVLG